MIKKINQPIDLKHIILLKEDNIQDYIYYHRDAWIQWLFSIIKSPNVLIIVDVNDNEETMAYAVVILAKIPPLSNSAQIVYLYQKEGYDIEPLLSEIEKWCLQNEVRLLEITTKDQFLDKSFSLKGYVMERKI